MRLLVLLMATWALDTFTGPDDAFIHDRLLDGGGIPGLVERGQWKYHSGPGANGISIVGERAVMEPHGGGGTEFIRYGVQSLDGLGADYSVEVTGQFHSPMSNEVGGGFTFTSNFGALVRGNFSPTDPIRGYFLALNEGNAADEDGEDLGTHLELTQFYDDGGPGFLTTVLALVPLNDPDDLTAVIEADTDYTLRLCVSGDGETSPITLQAYFNGELKRTFVIGTDLPNDPGNAGDVRAFADGQPGLHMGDLHGDLGTPPDPLVSASRFTVAGPGDGTVTPPVGPVTPEAILWMMARGQWRPIPVSRLRMMARGQWRPISEGRVSMMRHGQWRSLVLDPEYHGDPGDEPADQGCVDAGPWIPPVAPDPLTDRLLFLWDLPPHLINVVTPFTASVQGMPSVPGYLAAAQTRGGAIIGSQGGYTKFRSGGAYSGAVMDAFIESLAGLSSMLEDAQGAGYFYGVSIFDDFEGKTLWPPSGISHAEIERVANKWKEVFDWGIRTTIRGRPTQLVGGSFPSLDGCIAQWRFDLGSPSAFMAAELSAAASLGGKNILWSVNLQNGGNGSSGIPGTRAGRFEMSVSEVLAAGLQFASSATLNHGIGGWRYAPDNLNRSGMIDAWVTIRNALAAL